MLNRDLMPDVLKKYIFEYLRHRKNRSEKTISAYSYELANFLRFLLVELGKVSREIDFENIPIKEISVGMLKKVTRDTLYNYLDFLSDTNGSVARARTISCLKGFFRFLFIEKIIDENPAANIDSPKIIKRLPKYLTVDESIQLLEEIKKDEENENKLRNYAIVATFLGLGLRLSELIKIQVGHIRLDSDGTKYLLVHGKGRKERVLPMNSFVENAIEDYLENEREKVIHHREYLFIAPRIRGGRERGMEKSTVQKIVKHYLKKIGYANFSPHKLRHSFASQMYASNVGLKELQELMGHTSIATTEIYTHVQPHHLKGAMESNPLNRRGKEK